MESSSVSEQFNWDILHQDSSTTSASQPAESSPLINLGIKQYSYRSNNGSKLQKVMTDRWTSRKSDLQRTFASACICIQNLNEISKIISMDIFRYHYINFDRKPCCERDRTDLGCAGGIEGIGCSSINTLASKTPQEQVVHSKLIVIIYGRIDN